MTTSREKLLVGEQPLQLELCQRIHYTALHTALCQVRDGEMPASLSLPELNQQVRRQGREACLRHPAEIEQVFVGVTLAVYCTIEHFYCSRLGRSIGTVWDILQRQAQANNTLPISYEAVWAMCIYLEERRVAETTVTIERQDTTWIVAQLHSHVLLQDDFGEPYHPYIVCVIETPTDRVLAFRLGKTSACATTISFAIYDAFAAQRQPGTIVDVVAGLRWSFPTTIATDHLALPDDSARVCADLAIPVVQMENPPSILNDLRGDWDRDLANRVLEPRHFALIFDTHLRRIHGYGPHTTDQQASYDYAHLIGYNHDPAWQFPALRRLLPAQSGTATADGVVLCDGLHFENDLLTYWADERVLVRRSLQTDAAAYIYVDDEILCLAMARELRRTDGTYRTRQPERPY